MMKKILVAILVVMILSAATACSNQQKPSAGTGAMSDNAPTLSSTQVQEDSTPDVSGQQSQTPSTQSTTTKKDTDTAKTDADTTEAEKTTTSTTKKVVTPGKKDNGSFRYNGKELKIGMAANDALIKSLGQPIDIQNAPSCHYDGNDTIYVFNGFSVYTYADNGTDIIYLIELSGSNVSTSLGAKVGMSVSDVKALYGESTSQSGSALNYAVSGTTKLSFTYSGDTVTLIEYGER